MRQPVRFVRRFIAYLRTFADLSDKVNHDDTLVVNFLRVWKRNLFAGNDLRFCRGNRVFRRF